MRDVRACVCVCASLCAFVLGLPEQRVLWFVSIVAFTGPHSG